MKKIITMRGFTLTEILLASAILSVGAVFIGRAFQQCFFANSRAETVLRSSAILQKTAVSLILNGRSVGSAPPYQVDSELGPDEKLTLTPSEWAGEEIKLDQFTLSREIEGAVIASTVLLALKPSPENQTRKES